MMGLSGAPNSSLTYVAARFPVEVGNLHAAGVVEQHCHHVLLVDGRPDDQRGTEQTEEDERESRDAEGRQDDAVAQTSIDDLHSTVGEDRGGDYNADDKRGDE